jgi:predicted esterase
MLKSRNKLFLLFILPMIFLGSCKVMLPEGISPDSWYISEDQKVAIRFETARQGEYVSLDRALSPPKPFRHSRLGKVSKLKLSGGPAFKGQFDVFYDRFVITGKNKIHGFKQHITPVFPGSPFRYQEPITNEVTIQEVQYGSAPGYYESKTIEKRPDMSYTRVIFEVAGDIGTSLFSSDIPLHMDIYQPAGDTQVARPLIVLLHAGAFIVGDKRDELVSLLAQDYARKGFVVASVNYRLGYVFLPGRYSNLERAMYRAVQDVRAALRYLSHHKNDYRIDPNMIFLGGNSAGGITSLNVTLLDEPEVWPTARGSIMRMQSDLGCLDCSTNDLYGPFTIRGAINMWGAVHTLDIIQEHDQTPLLLIHGDQDLIVPYGTDYPFSNVSSTVSAFFSKKIHGSESILNHTQLLGIDHILYTFEGMGHEPHFGPDDQIDSVVYKTIHDLVLSFIGDQLFPDIDPVSGANMVASTSPPAYYSVEPRNYQQYDFDCEHCIILNETPNSARIVWIGGEDTYQLKIAGKGDHGQVTVDSLLILPSP